MRGPRRDGTELRIFVQVVVADEATLLLLTGSTKVAQSLGTDATKPTRTQKTSRCEASWSGWLAPRARSSADARKPMISSNSSACCRAPSIRRRKRAMN